MISIVVADDHAVVLSGVRMLLEAQPDFRVLGAAVDSTQALRLVERLRPNVLVIDLMMPGLTGLDVARRLSGSEARTRVVVLSMHASEAYIVEALRAGVTAYVVKEATSHELVEAIRSAAAGRQYLSAPLSAADLAAYVVKATASHRNGTDLTPRERQVLQLAAQGESNSTIARMLGIGRRTVETHRASIRAKLGIEDARDLRKYALRNGFTKLE